MPHRTARPSVRPIRPEVMSQGERGVLRRHIEAVLALTARAMSKENVEIVKGVAPPSGAEPTSLFADDPGAPERLEAIAPLFHAEFEFEAHGGPVAATAGGRCVGAC